MKKRIKHITLGSTFFGTILYLLLISACKKDPVNTDQGFRLSFSTDTVMFDTIFTTIGTTTRQLVVHNSGNKKVVIESVKLARGSSSPFRINIDGTSGFEVRDLEIDGNDSAYIFVKVTIDPNNTNNPLIETDSIVFRTNGNIQDVKLVAWGQDAYFYSPDSLLKGNVILPGNKPHVIYGTLFIDSLCTLTIPEGTKLYFHSNSGLYFKNGASLIVNGTLENPVLFLGDRLDEEYDDVPGQWQGIYFEGGSRGNLINYADLRNARYGIIADSSGLGDNPNLTLYNCIIHNMVNFGLLAIHTNVLALNSRITNCGGYAVEIQGGGICEFRHCTLSNHWSFSSKQFPTLSLKNYLPDAAGGKLETPLQSAFFGNCIIYGRGFDEIVLDSISGTMFNYRFDHCLVQSESASQHSHSFIECVINEDPKFMDPWAGYYELDTLSAAKDKGLKSIIDSSPKDLQRDMLGNSRISDLNPDLGCYERIESK
jgi:hypothetical protein